MEANILPTHPPWPCCWDQKVKIQLFQNIIMLHFKLKGIIKRSSLVANILPTDLSITALFGSKGQNSIFSEHCHAAYQIKGNPQMQQHGSIYVCQQIPP